PCAVDQRLAGGFRDTDHPAVDVLGYAGDHEFRRFAKALRPVLPNQIVISADAAGGDDHRLRAKREFADDPARAALAAFDGCWFENRAADALDRAIGDCERIAARPKPESQPAAVLPLARAPLERLDDAGPGAPGDVKARHRIAGPHRIIAAAFGPADHGKDAVAHRAQPVALFSGRERDIGLRPALRPKILIAVEARGADPVLQRQRVAVLDAEPALFGAIHKKKAGERTEGLAAEALLAFLVDHDDALAGVGDFGCRDQPGQSAADHDYVCVLSHPRPPHRLVDLTPRHSTRSTANAACLWPAGHLRNTSLFQFGTFLVAG